MKTKICTKCKKELLIIEFCKDNKSKDKLFGYCKKCHSEKYKDWILINKEKLKVYHKNYYKNNQKKIEKQQTQYRRIRRNKDVNYRILCNLRKRLWKVLNQNKKFQRIINLLGCSIKQLKEHLEKQFKMGMSWDNYGKKGWVIDHIIPCASFDLSKESEQKKCFNWKNLQPLWAEDNLRKGDTC